jgi:hypothetical protein
MHFPSSVEIKDLEKSLLNEIAQGKITPPGQIVYFLHHGDNETIYYTDYHSVYHVSLNGDEIFRYEHPDLKVPEGIAIDKQGYLCVVGRGSQNVHRIMTSLSGVIFDIVTN